jgi:RNA polymerase sigma-70 factor, ECF subfamily
MNQNAANPIREQVDTIYRTESRRVFATLIRLLGDFDLAEETMHEAFATAVAQWSREGIPKNPRAWLVSVGRFRAIDTLRRRTRFDASLADLAQPLETSAPTVNDNEELEDDRLRLIFTCCHPALSPEAQVALMLREVCGLTTEEIASAFLIISSTLAQRIVRAKWKLNGFLIPWQKTESCGSTSVLVSSFWNAHQSLWHSVDDQLRACCLSFEINNQSSI